MTKISFAKHLFQYAKNEVYYFFLMCGKKLRFEQINQAVSTMRGIVFFLLFFSSFFAQAQRHYKVIAYISGDSQITAENIEVKKITHVHYTFATIENAVFSATANDSINLGQLKQLRSIHPKLKIIIALGGPKNSAGFSEAVNNDSSRTRLASSIVKYISSQQLDGVEIHWEIKPKGMYGNSFNRADQGNLIKLLKVLREQLDAQSLAEKRKKKDRYLLCIVGSSKRQYLWHSQLNTAHQYVDYITLQSFDYKVQILTIEGISKTLVSHHYGNLYHSPADSWMRLSVDKTVKEYINHKIPSRKLVMGISFSGQGWNNTYEESNGLYQWAESRMTEDLSYKNILAHYMYQPDYQVFWDKPAKAPFIYNKKNGVFISYDNKKSIRKKTLYIRRHRLGGAVFSNYGQDDGILLKPLKNGLRYIRMPFIIF